MAESNNDMEKPTMSEAPQEADPVSGVCPGVEQATNPASLVRPRQALRETVSTENEEEAEKPFDVQPEDEQARNPPSGVPPGDKQATNPVSRVHFGGLQEARETFPTGDEQAAGEHVATDIQPEDEQARNPTIYDYVLKVTGVVAEVKIGYNSATDRVTALGEFFSIPGWTNVVISVVIGVFLRFGEIRNVVAGCIQFELRCFNEDGFLEVLRDYESGKIEKRLEKKFLKIGIKTTGLEVKITNSEKVERTKADIEKRRSCSTPAKTESEVQKRRNEALSVTDERELSTKKEPDTKDPEKEGVQEIGTKMKESLIVTETDGFASELSIMSQPLRATVLKRVEGKSEANNVLKDAPKGKPPVTGKSEANNGLNDASEGETQATGKSEANNVLKDARKGKPPATDESEANNVLNDASEGETQATGFASELSIMSQPLRAAPLKRVKDRYETPARVGPEVIPMKYRNGYESLSTRAKRGEVLCREYYEMQSKHQLGEEKDVEEVRIWISNSDEDPKPESERSAHRVDDIWRRHLEVAIGNINNAAPGLKLCETREREEAEVTIFGISEENSYTLGNIHPYTGEPALIFLEDVSPEVAATNYHKLYATSCHELLHALCFYHEQQRPDSRNHLVYKDDDMTAQNVEESQIKPSELAIGITRFDPFSILLYPEDKETYLRNPEDKVWNLKTGNSANVKMSALDKVGLNIIYRPCERTSDYSPKLHSNGLWYCRRPNTTEKHNGPETGETEGICGPNSGPNCPACRVLANPFLQKIWNDNKWQGWSGFVYCGKKIDGEDKYCGPDTGPACEDCLKYIYPSKK